LKTSSKFTDSRVKTILKKLEFKRSTKKWIGLSTDFSSTISADSEPGPIYPGTHEVTCKRLNTGMI